MQRPAGLGAATQEIGKPLFDVIYVEGSDFHLRSKLLRMASTFRPTQPTAIRQIRSLVIFITLRRNPLFTKATE